MKRRNTQNSKLRKSGNPTTKPLIIEKKSIANEREIRNKIKKKLTEKITGDNNMAKDNKRPKKGSSGLERPSNTKKDFDYLVGSVNEAQQKIPNEPTIGVNQPINSNIELLKIADNIGKNQGNSGGGNNSFFEEVGKKMLYDVMSNPQQPQQQNQGSNSDFIKLMGMWMQSQDKKDELRAEKSDMRLAMLMQQQNSGQPQEPPEERLRKSMTLVKEIQGEQRVRTKDELDFGLKKQELVLKESARQDMLNREERAVEREDRKSERILGIGQVVLDKVIGNGLGTLIDDVMGAKGGKGKRRGRAKQPLEEFDPSLLDEL